MLQSLEGRGNSNRLLMLISWQWGATVLTTICVIVGAAWAHSWRVLVQTGQNVFLLHSFRASSIIYTPETTDTVSWGQEECDMSRSQNSREEFNIFIFIQVFRGFFFKQLRICKLRGRHFVVLCCCLDWFWHPVHTDIHPITLLYMPQLFYQKNSSCFDWTVKYLSPLSVGPLSQCISTSGSWPNMGLPGIQMRSPEMQSNWLKKPYR